jgi:hypothetical protein
MKLLILTILLVSCDMVTPTAIDGTGVGPEMQCPSPVCTAIQGTAEGMLESAAPSHPAVTSSHIYPWNPQPQTTGGTYYVVTLELQDGPRQVVRVHCGTGVAPQTECLPASKF